jgi:hypothetical protein
VIGIVHSEHHRTPLSCSAVHSYAAWLQSCCGSPGRLAVHSCEDLISVYSLEALQAGFEDPVLGPPTHSCENTLFAFELYEIEISVATSICRLLVILLTISSSVIILLIDEQLRLPCRLLVLYCSRGISSSCIILLIFEQLRLPCQLILLYCSSMSSSHIILLISEQLPLPCRLI